MTINYYCIPTCDKCRAARKLLKVKALDYQEIDMRKDGLDASLINRWIEVYGLDKILNDKSATWKKLDPNLKAQINENPSMVINTNAAMLKRPLLDFGDHILTQKDALNWLENA